MGIAPLYRDISIHSVASTEHTDISPYTRATPTTDRQYTPVPTSTLLEAKTVELVQYLPVVHTNSQTETEKCVFEKIIRRPRLFKITIY